MDAFAVLQPCDGAWRGGREGPSDTQRAVRVTHIAHDAPMTDRRRIVVLLRVGRRGRLVTLRADEVRDAPDRRGRIVVLRDGTEVAKFRAKNVVGWHQTDD